MAKTTISNALKQRGSVCHKRQIHRCSEPSLALIRYGLETNDPWLTELVRRADAGETIIDTVDFSQTPAPSEDDSSEEKIEALTEMICRAGDKPETKSAALLVLMATLEMRHIRKLLRTRRSTLPSYPPTEVAVKKP